jgi:hypothetical protein
MQSEKPTWPPLVYADWQDSCATLHMWTQIVGKIRLALAPPVNHWWHVPLYLTSRGPTTSPMPYGGRTFQIDFDFIDHVLRIAASDGRRDSLALVPRSVADFYAEVMGRLRALGIEVRIWPVPVEIADPIPFDQDQIHASYDPVQVNRFWHALAQIDQVFAAFRSRFIGKASPVHFFWGSFDLAVTRFSGRGAPPTRTRSAAAVSGRAMAASDRPPSIPTPIRNPRALARRRSSRVRRSTARKSANSSCPTRRSANPPRRATPCSNSCRAPTPPPPISRNGTARRWRSESNPDLRRRASVAEGPRAGLGFCQRISHREETPCRS